MPILNLWLLVKSVYSGYLDLNFSIDVQKNVKVYSTLHPPSDHPFLPKYKKGNAVKLDAILFSNCRVMYWISR